MTRVATVFLSHYFCRHFASILVLAMTLTSLCSHDNCSMAISTVPRPYSPLTPHPANHADDAWSQDRQRGITTTRRLSQPMLDDMKLRYAAAQVSSAEELGFNRQRRFTVSNDLLTRKATLLPVGNDPVQTSKQLKTILGDHSARLKSRASLPQSVAADSSRQESLRLEQANARPRVEVDLSLDSSTCVQGGSVSGKIRVNIRQASKKETPIMLSEGKVRIVGFERLSDQDCHHTFYLQVASLSSISTASSILYLPMNGLREEFSRAVEGHHEISFTLHLPIDNERGNAKGTFDSHPTASIRYIVMV